MHRTRCRIFIYIAPCMLPIVLLLAAACTAQGTVYTWPTQKEFEIPDSALIRRLELVVGASSNYCTSDDKGQRTRSTAPSHQPDGRDVQYRSFVSAQYIARLPTSQRIKGEPIYGTRHVRRTPRPKISAIVRRHRAAGQHSAPTLCAAKRALALCRHARPQLERRACLRAHARDDRRLPPIILSARWDV
ncbi:hypothetical protein FKP32DRAFT_980259 [Trametes sanguinea]|nr:hypothetical protein FKP32DRAFT_980259 [Trametes sanguinea]